MQPAPADPLLGIVRTSNERVLTGLLGGIARRTGLPVLPIRIGLVVLTFVFAGVPALVYLVAAAGVRAEDATESHLQRWLRPGSRAAFPLTVAIGIALAGVVSGTGFDGLVQTITALALVAGGLYLATGQHEKHPVTSTDASSSSTKVDNPPKAATIQDDPTDPASMSPASSPATSSTLDDRQTERSVPAPTTDAASPVVSPFTPPPPRPGAVQLSPAGRPLAYTVAEPTPARPRRERSIIGPLVLGIAALAVAVGWALNAIGVDAATPALIASLGLMVVGLGVAVAALAGRSTPGLIPLGLLALGLTYGLHLVDSQDVNLGERSITPTVIADDVVYEHFAGAFVLDLRATEFTETADPHRVTVDVSFGEVLVHLPEGLDVAINASLGVGEIEHGQIMMDGTDLTHTVRADGEPELILDIEAGVGRIEVTQ